MNTALEVRSLAVGFPNRRGDAIGVVVQDVDLDVVEGRILGLAGESGCGKSTTALAAIGFPIPGAVVLRGTALFGKTDLLALPASRLRTLWGRQIAYVAQDATTALDPLCRIEKLLGEPLHLHLGMRGAALRARATGILESVGIGDPQRALRSYPHQFSGGQQQRIALGIAFACNPSLLVLDEPTTGLDVTTQAQIVRLIRSLVDQSGAAALFISHNLPLLATVCDETAIMYAGEVVERSSADQIYLAPRHPYTAALADAVPSADIDGLVVGIPGMPPAAAVNNRCSFADRCRFATADCDTEHPTLAEVRPGHHVRCLRTTELGRIASQRPLPLNRIPPGVREASSLLVVSNLLCTYRGRRKTTAVHDVSLTVAPGEVVAVVGESGSGKSTLLRAVAGLHPPDLGDLEFEGVPLIPRAVNRDRRVRRAIQIVFQDPHSSLNPVHSIHQTLDRPLKLFQPHLDKTHRADEILKLLHDFRLDREVLSRRPHELSGGQKQRVALARAFAAAPKLILCDEVVSALDVSVQASILELLVEIVQGRGTALLFVTHDLAVVRAIANRICVMREGRFLETSPKGRLFDSPSSPYTRELLAAIPRPERANSLASDQIKLSPHA